MNRETKYDVTWLKGKGAQQYLLTQKNNDTLIVKQYELKRKVHSWALSHPDKLLSILSKNRGIYEIITDEKRKLYFDIDGHETTIDIEKVKEKIKEILPDAELNISGYENSYHICVSNYHLDNVNSCVGVRQFCKENKELGFDWKVYTKNRAMKCVGQSKPDGPVQEILEGSKDVKDHLITCFFKNNSKDAKEYFKSFEEFSDQPLIINSIPQGVNPYTEEIPISNVNCDKLIYLISPEHDHKVSYTIALYLCSLGYGFEDFWNWRKRKNDDINIRNKWLTHWNEIEKLTKEGRNHVTRETIVKILKRLYTNLEDSYYERCFYDNSNYLLDKDIKRQFADKNMFTDKKIDYVVLPMGSGKTKALIEYLAHKTNHNIENTVNKIEDSFNIDSFIFLNCRVSLAMNMQSRFSDQNIVNYKDMATLKNILNQHKIEYDKKKISQTEIKKLALPLCKKLITTPYSLHYNKDSLFDLVVIDEIESFHNAWTDDTTHKVKDLKNNYRENWDTFVRIVKNAKKVICLDALYSSNTIKMFESIGILKDDINIIGSTFDYPVKQLIIHNEKTRFFEVLIEKLKENKKIYMFYPYKTQTKKIDNQETVKRFLEKRCGRELKCLIYNGDTDKKTLKDVNKNWSQCDIVIVNQCITVGVNYDIENCFDSVFICDSAFVSTREIVQTSCRVRNSKSNEIHYTYLGGARPSCITNISKEYSIPDEYISCVNNEKMSKSISTVKYMFNKANIIQQNVRYKRNRNFKMDFNDIVKDDAYEWDNIDDIYDVSAYERLVNSDSSNVEDHLKIIKYKFREAIPTNSTSLLKEAWTYRNSFVNYYNLDDMLLDVFNRIKNEPMSHSDKILDENERNYFLTKYTFRDLDINSKSDAYVITKVLNYNLGMTYYSMDKNSKTYQLTDDGSAFYRTLQEIKNCDIFQLEEEEGVYDFKDFIETV